MSWIKLLIELFKLEPEIQSVIVKIIGAVSAAPVEHQKAVKDAVVAADKQLGGG